MQTISLDLQSVLQLMERQSVFRGVSLEDLSTTWIRQIYVSTESRENVDLSRVQPCEEVLWMVEPKEASELGPSMQRMRAEATGISSTVRVVWLLSNEQLRLHSGGGCFSKNERGICRQPS